jgi:hypothetical protein
MHWMLLIWLCTQDGCSPASPLLDMSAEQCITTRQTFLSQHLPKAGDPHWSEARCAPQDRS